MISHIHVALGRPAEAKVQFEKALARAPMRSLSLEGLAMASKKER